MRFSSGVVIGGCTAVLVALQLVLGSRGPLTPRSASLAPFDRLRAPRACRGAGPLRPAPLRATLAQSAGAQRSAAGSDAARRAEFTFTRIRYGSGGRGFGFGFGASAWSHDYPRADQHLSRLLEYLTTLDANIQRTNVFDLDDPRLFDHPIAYISEPGFWTLTATEAENLRAYVRKGGFLIFDDFEAEQWHNFEAQVRRALPNVHFKRLDVTHPIFHSFFEMKQLNVPHPMVNVTPEYHGIFDTDGTDGQMLAIVNYNSDLAEYWEWSDTGYFPVDLNNESYKLGINYIVYGMTH